MMALVLACGEKGLSFQEREILEDQLVGQWVLDSEIVTYSKRAITFHEDRTYVRSSWGETGLIESFSSGEWYVSTDKQLVITTTHRCRWISWDSSGREDFWQILAGLSAYRQKLKIDGGSLGLQLQGLYWRREEYDQPGSPCCPGVQVIK